MRKRKNNSKTGIAIGILGVLLFVFTLSANANFSLLDKVAQVAGEIWGMKLAEKTDVGELTFGAVSGPDIYSPYLTVNGAPFWFYSSKLNQASSTLCSFKTPTATSTLVIGSLRVTGGNDSSLFFEIGKSSQMDSTTTSLGIYTASANTRFTMMASTTEMDAADNVDPAWTFPPSNYLVFKTSSTTPYAITGNCRAMFLEN